MCIYIYIHIINTCYLTLSLSIYIYIYIHNKISYNAYGIQKRQASNRISRRDLLGPPC